MTGLELLEVDHLLTVDERDIQAEVRDFVDRRVKPRSGIGTNVARSISA